MLGHRATSIGTVQDAAAGRWRSGLEAQFLINGLRFTASQRRIRGDAAAA